MLLDTFLYRSVRQLHAVTTLVEEETIVEIVDEPIINWLEESFLSEKVVRKIASLKKAKKYGKGQFGYGNPEYHSIGNNIAWNSPKYKKLDRFYTKIETE